jgi:Fur family ferric uptake transcriptional regulator
MIEEILNKKEVRITPMRQLLLEFFLEKNKILGLSDLEKAFPKSDRVTIYRTLKTFEEKGIIHSIVNGTAEVKYALCHDCQVANHSDLHPHFYCLKCEELSCLESVFIPMVELPRGYSFEKMEMTIQGICQKCQEQSLQF